VKNITEPVLESFAAHVISKPDSEYSYCNALEALLILKLFKNLYNIANLKCVNEPPDDE
jgi:hypothetical protein